LCGDTVLDPITPNPEDLLAYLQTLRKLSFERDIVLTLPAHGRPIYDLQGRIREIEARHETRLRMTYEACAEPTPAWSIAVMDGYFDTTVDPRKFNLLAGREVIVHLDLLETAGALTRTGRKGGVDYFRNTGEAFDSVYERIRELIADGAPAGGILNA
jgi:glyoxylase-like metal-dependent hydrolase (beta-lactamase superfamily II)